MKQHAHSGRGAAGVKPRPRPPLFNVPALFAEGLALHQAGRLAEAEQIYHRVLAMQSDHADSLHLLGVIALQRGKHAQAVAQIDLALRCNPANAFAHNNRGAALKELKRFVEALASYDAAIALKPDYAEAHSNRGVVLHQLRRFEEALASYERALALRPDYAEAHQNRGNTLHALRRYGEALASYERAIALRPSYAEAHANRAVTLHELKRYEEALASGDRAVVLMPNSAEAHYNRGKSLKALRRFDEAVASYDRALALQPGNAETHYNRGNALQELKRFDEALASYDRALALQPDYAEAHSNRGVTLYELQRLAEALVDYDRALALRPDFADAHFNAACCRLLGGDFTAGWRQYEWRWQTAQLGGEKRNFVQPLWLGAGDIAGKTILLHAEQGLGDTIQFARYAPLVSQRGARVILEVQTPLHGLVSGLPGVAQTVSRGDPLPDFDMHCPLLSLPLAFGTQSETIPGATPYLAAPDSKARAWRDRLGPRGKPRIGLVWAGNPRKELAHANRIDRQRSLEFGRLAPLLEIADCAFYSLQKGDEAVMQMRDHTLCHRVTDWTDELHDFSNTAALIENLDLVLSVDTSVAHLAGALGKPLWLLNRFNTCWRWLLERADSPWYPSARLFRQTAARDWDDVIGEVHAALYDYVRSR